MGTTPRSPALVAQGEYGVVTGLAREHGIRRQGVTDLRFGQTGLQLRDKILQLVALLQDLLDAGVALVEHGQVAVVKDLGLGEQVLQGGGVLPAHGGRLLTSSPTTNL
ncbi:MAG: hypothetical protein GXP62_07060 [Oligoflexia bacterium]|nr:hypothetical protein [Oligoflexia bacterium]